MPEEIKRSVMLVEDETSIRGGLVDAFSHHGYGVISFGDGESAWSHAQQDSFDLAILDVMLPGMDGFELCGKLRRGNPSVPILMLTAKGSEDDIVTGFGCGADDYVTKPFSVRELLVRVEALLRRVGASPHPPTIDFGSWTVDPTALRATSDGDARDLTPRELELVWVFVRETGRVVSRRTLLRDVWGMSHADDIETRTVDMHVAKLRKKLDPDARWLTTVRGAGYRFEP